MFRLASDWSIKSESVDTRDRGAFTSTWRRRQRWTRIRPETLSTILGRIRRQHIAVVPTGYPWRRFKKMRSSEEFVTSRLHGTDTVGNLVRPLRAVKKAACRRSDRLVGTDREETADIILQKDQIGRIRVFEAATGKGVRAVSSQFKEDSACRPQPEPKRPRAAPVSRTAPRGGDESRWRPSPQTRARPSPQLLPTKSATISGWRTLIAESWTRVRKVSTGRKPSA